MRPVLTLLVVGTVCAATLAAPLGGASPPSPRDVVSVAALPTSFADLDLDNNGCISDAEFNVNPPDEGSSTGSFRSIAGGDDCISPWDFEQFVRGDEDGAELRSTNVEKNVVTVKSDFSNGIAETRSITGNTNGNTITEECCRPDWGRTNYSHCTFNLTWPQIAGRLGAETITMKTGGLGTSMAINGHQEVWLCVKNETGSNETGCGDDGGYFCYVYDEDLEEFVAWGTNTDLKLFDVDAAGSGTGDGSGSGTSGTNTRYYTGCDGDDGIGCEADTSASMRNNFGGDSSSSEDAEVNGKDGDFVDTTAEES